MGEQMQDRREQLFDEIAEMAKEEGVPSSRPSTGRFRVELNTYWTAEIEAKEEGSDIYLISGIIDGEIEGQVQADHERVVEAVRLQIAGAR